MTRTRFTDERVINCPAVDCAAINETGILAEHEAGAKYAGRCRKHGMSEGTFYNWKGVVALIGEADSRRES